MQPILYILWFIGVSIATTRQDSIDVPPTILQMQPASSGQTVNIYGKKFTVETRVF